MVSVPLTSGDAAIGALGVARDASDPRSFSESEAERLQRFAQLAMIALDNARLYASAQEARDAADAANAAKSTFLAAMSHEIRTPLTGVLGMADLLVAETLGERQQRYANAIRTSGRHLLSVINDILDFSRIEAGKLELEEIDFSTWRPVGGGAVADGAAGSGARARTADDTNHVSRARGAG